MYKVLIGMSIGLMAAAAYGFLPDDPATTARQSSKAAGPALTARQPSAQQLQAAGQLREAEVQWDRRTGAPLSVRGKLGTQNLGGKGLRAEAKGDFERDAVAVLDSLSAVYAVQDAAGEFAVSRVEADNLGFHHVRVRQLHQGLRVVGCELIVHFNKANQGYQVNGRYLPGINVAVTPALTPAEAVSRAQADLKARGKPAGALQGAPELVVFADNSEPRLAYELVLAYPANPEKIPGRWVYTVDALNGYILNAYNAIPSAAAAITGDRLTGEGGESVSVTGTLEGGFYYLKSALWLIHNNDATASFVDSNSDARRTTASWGASDRVEMSAAVNFSAIQNYYAAVHGRSSYNGSGAKATVNVHHEYGSEYNNAYWSPDEQQFFFYDGDGVELNGLTVTDVSAHEFTHAVDEYTANLTYRNESGALNESFSDVFGALVEFHTQPNGRDLYPGKRAGYADWLLAEDSEVAVAAMRDMRNPSSTVTLEANAQQPSKYQGTYWYSGSEDNGGVHINSGVQNFFFYLLCEGGSGDNDGTNYNVTGIGITNAGQVAYRALTVYCTPSTDYAAARTAWLSAAADLNASWTSVVQAAWAAVGVTGSTPTPPTPSVRYTPQMDDFDGDNYGDPTLYDATAGCWYIRLSAYNYAMVSFESGASAAFRPVSGYFDSDWKADPTVYSTASGRWYMALSTDSYNWWYLDWYVNSSCLPVCADFDGDWYPDPTLYSPNTGNWYVLASTYGWDGHYYLLEWAAPSGYLPFGGDFDGDWYADPAFYSPDSGYWYVLVSSRGYQSASFFFGAAGYTAGLGDFEGDLRVDPIMRSVESAHWYVLLSSRGYQIPGYFDFVW